VTFDLDAINRQFADDPQGLIQWATGLGQKSVCTSNFRPFAAVILHMCTRAQPDMPVLWMDNGYGTPATYQFADELTRLLKLNLHIYHPRRSRAHSEAVDGAPPGLGDPRLVEFTREVKLEPFERAVREMKPEVWFTAVRGEDTTERAAMQPVSITGNGLIKVAPLLKWSSKDMHEYCKKHGLPNNFDYFDPTKIEENRECGLHTVS
jgi:phosphoadenosine phosphosulfate reductase